MTKDFSSEIPYFNISFIFKRKWRFIYFNPLWLFYCHVFFSSQRNTDHITRSQESHGTIYSPFKDVLIPDMTFTEYVFSKLDQYKNLTCLVSFSI